MNSARNVVQLPRSAAPKVEPFRPFYASQIEGREAPPIEWIIDGVLMRGTVCLLSGAPKVGKSLLLQQLLTATSLGVDWLGKETVKSRSFGLFCEDPQAILHRRQEDILAHYGHSAADLEVELSWDSRDGKDAVLAEFDRYSPKPKFTSLWSQLWDFVQEDGIEVVGLDTAAAIFSGNEVDRQQVTAFMRELQKQAVKTNGCIVLNAHPNKVSPNGYSGTTAWLASARSGMSLGRPEDWNPETGEPRDVRVLRGLGSNYGAGLTAERIEYQDGVFVPGEPDLRQGAKRGPLNHNERMDLKYRLLIGLKRVMMNGGKVPADDEDPKSMPRRARRSTDPSINRISFNELNFAQHEMLESGMLVRVAVDGRCLVRPHDGPFYNSESPWQMPEAPAKAPSNE
jgi:hypothetical protein